MARPCVGLGTSNSCQKGHLSNTDLSDLEICQQPLGENHTYWSIASGHMLPFPSLEKSPLSSYPALYNSRCRSSLCLLPTTPPTAPSTVITDLNYWGG